LNRASSWLLTRVIVKYYLSG